MQASGLGRERAGLEPTVVSSLRAEIESHSGPVVHMHSQGAGAAWGPASLTTCLHPGWSGRWGPRRAHSAAQLSSHHCGVPDGGQ